MTTREKAITGEGNGLLLNIAAGVTCGMCEDPISAHVEDRTTALPGFSGQLPRRLCTAWHNDRQCGCTLPVREGK